MAELLGDKGGFHVRHQADCRIRVTAVIWPPVANAQVFQCGAPLVVNIGGLSDVFLALRPGEDVGRRLDAPNAEQAAISVCLGKPKRSEGSLIQQHEPVPTRLRSLFYTGPAQTCYDREECAAPVDVFPPKRERFRNP